MYAYYLPIGEKYAYRGEGGQTEKYTPLLWAEELARKK